jgi:hypothetical protein
LYPWLTDLALFDEGGRALSRSTRSAAWLQRHLQATNHVTKISFQIAETFLKQPLMALLIVELPHDILISIFLHLSIESVLSLKQASHILTSPSTDTLNMHGLTRRRVVVYMLSAPQTTSGTDQ